MDPSSNLARQLLDAAPDPGIVISVDGTIVHANARVKDVLGYEPSELIEEHMEVLLPERFRPRHPDHRARFFGDPAPRPMGTGLELFALCKSGKEIPVEISLSPVTTAAGTLVFAALRDVSEQKKLERELIEANRAKSRFLAAASHDLRQPIQALTLLNKVASKPMTQDARQTLIEKQQRSLDSMARLLNALLDISKLEAGIVKPDISDCVVQEIFNDLRAEFEIHAQDKGLELVVDQCNDIARSDPRLLAQILENLVSNAIRYTREGMVQLRCFQQAFCVRIDVVDTGLGIPSEDLESIFEEFHQADAGTTRPEGLGLGLSIVKRTAELLGCKLEVSSKVGEGSVFSVSVPLGERSEVPVTPDDSQQVVVEGGRILVVDDEPAVADATSMLLQAEGFEVQVASTVSDALQALDEITPDLLITDYHLRGGVTGLDVVRAVREKYRRDLPVILVSGDTSDRGLTDKVEEMILMTKPVDADKLLAEIRRRLGT